MAALRVVRIGFNRLGTEGTRGVIEAVVFGENKVGTLRIENTTDAGDEQGVGRDVGGAHFAAGDELSGEESGEDNDRTSPRNTKRMGGGTVTWERAATRQGREGGRVDIVTEFPERNAPPNYGRREEFEGTVNKFFMMMTTAKTAGDAAPTSPEKKKGDKRGGW